MINRENFPVNIIKLSLVGQKLTGLVGENLLTAQCFYGHLSIEREVCTSLSAKLNAISVAQLISEKVTVDLSSNDFEGDFVTNLERFSQRSHTSEGDDIQLGSPLDLREIDGIAVDEGPCIPNIKIIPEDTC